MHRMCKFAYPVTVLECDIRWPYKPTLCWCRLYRCSVQCLSQWSCSHGPLPDVDIYSRLQLPTAVPCSKLSPVHWANGATASSSWTPQTRRLPTFGSFGGRVRCARYARLLNMPWASHAAMADKGFGSLSSRTQMWGTLCWRTFGVELLSW